MPGWRSKLAVFSTCPASNHFASGPGYAERVDEVAQWSEAAGCEGILVYTDNGLVDPWLVAHRVIEHTTRLAPLVAVQPVYTHPYTVAKQVTSLAYLHGRRVYLNMVAGGFKNDLLALADPTPHDERYARLIEYTTIVQALCRGGPVTADGRFHRVTNLKLAPPLPAEFQPGVFVSGSSDAGREAARRLGAVAIEYPQPAEAYPLREPDPTAPVGIRVGIIARTDVEAAWAVAHTRFPDDRRGQLAHQLAMKVSDSSWHAQLSRTAEQARATPDSPYWLHPFENYKTFCPYLVGTYERVADEIARYAAAGYRTLILDVPPSREELAHTGIVLERVAGRLAA